MDIKLPRTRGTPVVYEQQPGLITDPGMVCHFQKYVEGMEPQTDAQEQVLGADHNNTIHNPNDGSYFLIDPEGKWSSHITAPLYNDKTGRVESVITTDHGFKSKEGTPYRIEQKFDVDWSKSALDGYGGLKEETIETIKLVNDGISSHYQGVFSVHSDRGIEKGQTTNGPLFARDTDVMNGMKGLMCDLIVEVEPMNKVDGSSGSTIAKELGEAMPSISPNFSPQLRL